MSRLNHQDFRQKFKKSKNIAIQVKALHKHLQD
jgi:hypothetical protein